MQLAQFRSRSLSLLTAGILATGACLQAAPAHADNSKTLKYGAIGLGALGAYMLSKGKKLEGAAALGGAYYAYTKSKQNGGRNNVNRSSRNDISRYSQYLPQAGAILNGGQAGGASLGGYDLRPYLR